MVAGMAVNEPALQRNREHAPQGDEDAPTVGRRDLQAGEELSQLHVVEDEEGQTCGSSFRQNAVFV